MPNVTAVPVEIGNAVPAAAVEPKTARPAAPSETYLPDERAILATYLPSFLRVCASLARWPSRPPLPAAAASFAAGVFLPGCAPSGVQLRGMTRPFGEVPLATANASVIVVAAD